MRLRLRISGLVISSTLLVACQASPGPAPVEEAPTTTESSTTETTPVEEPETRETINVGIDSLRNGFNPHLIADDTAFVRDISSLVLPSAFVDDHLNTDLLKDVEQTSANTVKYTIAPEAQWSDGTPITGSDFEFLRKSIVSTPGTIDAAAYRQMAEIRISGGGKTVEVIFQSPVADWHNLFANLLPSHLIQGSADTFNTALYDAIPASAGRYMIRSIDRQRGVISLSRNDRFWGENPARVEMLTFHSAGTASRAGEYLRTGQSLFMNLRPSETLVDTLSLLPNSDVRVSNTDRTLELVLRTDSLNPQQRAHILSLIDVPLAARLAGARSANLSVAETQTFNSSAVELPELRFAVDAADDASVAAGRAIVDMLANYGIKATTMTTDIPSAIEGDFDGMITWTRNGTDALSLADRYECDANLASWCEEETEGYLQALIAGEIPFDASWENQLNVDNAIRLPILHETRVEALGKGIVGPDPQAWPGGIASAANWRMNEIAE